MATIDHETSPRLTPAVRYRLDDLRARIRGYVWREGIAAAAVWACLAFWASLAIDWCLELPRAARAVALVAAAVVLAAIVYRYILRRAFVRMSDGNMATLLERRFRQLDDSLLTTVTLSGRPPEQTGFNREMLAVTNLSTERLLDEVHPGEVLNPYPLRQKVVLAICLAGTVGLVAWAAPSFFHIWADRNVLLADRVWPRHIHLVAPGFTDGVAKVGAGRNFPFQVYAVQGDTEKPVVPDSADIRYRIEGGGRGRYSMDAIGASGGTVTTAAGEQAEVLQEFRHTFKNVLATHRFDVVGGDARLKGLTLQVVPNPACTLALKYEFPDYIEPRTDEKKVDGVMPVLVGTKLTISGTANKALDGIRIDCPAADKRPAWRKELGAADLGAEGKEFSYTFTPFDAPPAVSSSGSTAKSGTAAAPAAIRDCVLRFTLRDADGIESLEPTSLALVALPDQPPEIKVSRYGIGNAITANARLPMTGKIIDDHGLAKAWFDYTVWTEGKDAQKRSGTAPLANLPLHPREFAVKDKEAALEAADAKLVRGQKLLLTIRAADLCNLGAGANVGSSESWQIDVVSPEELRNQLEARELVLRQRFESIVMDMTVTRDLLLKPEFWPTDQAGGETKPVKVAGAEPGEKPVEARKLSADEMNARRLESVLMALQNCRKSAQETKGVAEGIDDIRLQYTNNRVESTELKDRLDAGVAQPLHRIIDEQFPMLDKGLVDLQELVTDPKLGPERRAVARQRADEILLAMKAVLGRMMALDDYNVAVLERLRKLIKMQDDITNKTEKKRTERIKELLE